MFYEIHTANKTVKSLINTLSSAKRQADALAKERGEKMTVRALYDDGRLKNAVAHVAYPPLKRNPGPRTSNPARRVARPSSFYSAPKWPAEIKAKDHPLGHTIRYSTVKEAQAAALRLANMYQQPVAVTINDGAARTFARNPRGIGGIGYYSYTNPETGEKILDDDLERIKRLARKLANRLGRAIQVRADYSGRRVK